MLSSLAGRLARLARQCGPEEEARAAEAAGGAGLSAISGAIVDALDADRQIAEARRTFDLPAGAEPTEVQIQQTARALLAQAAAPIAASPALRRLLQDLKRRFEQIIDDVSEDEVLEAGASPDAQAKARALTASFARYLEDHREEIDALRFFYAQPYAARLRYDDLKALAAALRAPPRAWTPEKLWRAYETLDRDKVRGASAGRLLTDLVSLVRYALRRDGELAPFADRVRGRFDHWLARQRAGGRDFTPEQRRWLEMIRDHVAASVEMTVDDFDYAPFAEAGGLGRATRVFGEDLPTLLDELNEALAA